MVCAFWLFQAAHFSNIQPGICEAKENAGIPHHTVHWVPWHRPVSLLLSTFQCLPMSVFYVMSRVSGALSRKKREKDFNSIFPKAKVNTCHLTPSQRYEVIFSPRCLDKGQILINPVPFSVPSMSRYPNTDACGCTMTTAFPCHHRESYLETLKKISANLSTSTQLEQSPQTFSIIF